MSEPGIYIGELRKMFQARFKVSPVVDSKAGAMYSPVYVRGLEARYEKAMEHIEKVRDIIKSRGQIIETGIE